MSAAPDGRAGKALATPLPARYAPPIAEKEAIRDWRPDQLALQAAPTFGSAAFVFACSAHGFAYGRPCGEGREPLPVPVAGTPTPHGSAALHWRGGRQVQNLSNWSHHG